MSEIELAEEAKTICINFRRKALKSLPSENEVTLYNLFTTTQLGVEALIKELKETQ